MIEIIIIINNNRYFYTRKSSYEGCELILIKPELYSISFIHNRSFKEFSLTSRPNARDFYYELDRLGGKDIVT